MTPISFALELLLDCTTIEQVHKRCRKFIKEQENGLGRSNDRSPILGPTGRPSASNTPIIAAQAPSTQRLMAEHGHEIAITPTTPVVRLPPTTIDKETGLPQVQTGNGMRGPKKW